LGIVLLIFTVVFGDGKKVTQIVCYFGLEAPGDLSPLIGVGFYGTLNSTGAAIDSCYQGKSLLQAVTSTGIFNFDIVEQANTAFTDVDFGTINSIDLNGTLSNDPTADASNSSNVDLSGMTIEPFTDINSNCSALLQDLDALKLALENVTSSDLNDTSEFPDWQLKLAPVLVEINSAIQRTYLVGNHSSDLSDIIVETNNTAKAMINSSSSISPSYKEAVAQIELFAASASANVIQYLK
jgi:hypothetical protein